MDYSWLKRLYLNNKFKDQIESAFKNLDIDLYEKFDEKPNEYFEKLVMETKNCLIEECNSTNQLSFIDTIEIDVLFDAYLENKLEAIHAYKR